MNQELPHYGNVVKDIKELNLLFLLKAKELVDNNDKQLMSILGLSADLANALSDLNQLQIMQLAQANHLLMFKPNFTARQIINYAHNHNAELFVAQTLKATKQ